MKARINYLILTLLICLSILSHVTCAQTPRNTNDLNETDGIAVYRVAFDDSGVVGLIFALDVLQELEPQLEDLESKYKVHFIFQHIGDSKNAPYGIKTPVEITELTKDMVEYTANLPCTRTLVIACNTASTACNKEMDLYFKEKYPQLNIISMIEKSSKEILDMALNVSSDKEDLYIALFATPATIRSGAYQTQIERISVDNNQKVKLFTYSPAKWVDNIEQGIDIKRAEIDVQNDLEGFRINVGDDFRKIPVVGLFCTHYPYYKKEIEQYFNKRGNNNLEILTQGHIFSDDIFF